MEAEWLFETGENEFASESRAWLTVERAAYIATGLLAAAVRFAGLGLRPLNAAEAEQALAAFRFLAGDLKVAPAGTLPTLFTGNVLGFTVAGAGDATARWLPAVAGLVLALLPYALRDRLGRGGALVASLLLALSPTAVFASRTADGSSLVAACALAIVVGLLNYTDSHRPAWLYVAAAGFGIGLAAGPGIYSVLLIVAVFGLLLFLTRTSTQVASGWEAVVAAFETVRERRQGEEEDTGRSFSSLTIAAAVAAGAFALAATTFALHPAGIGHAADLLGTWVQSLLPEAGEQPALYPLLLLLRYEPLILFLAAIEIVEWARSRSALPRASRFDLSHTAFLAFWAGAALLLSVVGGRDPGSVLLAIVPMALLAGMAVTRVIAIIRRRVYGSDVALAAAIVLAIGTFLYLQLAAYSHASATTSRSIAGITIYASTTHLLLALVPILLVLVLGVIAWLWRGPGLPAAAAWLALVVVLALFGIKEMWSANFRHAADPRELMLLQTTDPEVHLLVDHLEALSLDRRGDRYTLPVTVDTDLGPVVDWYVRRFQAAQPAQEAALLTPPGAVVAPADQDPALGEGFRGQSYLLHTHWAPWGLWGQDLVRWLLFTEDSLPVVDREVVLWVSQE